MKYRSVEMKYQVWTHIQIQMWFVSATTTKVWTLKKEKFTFFFLFVYFILLLFRCNLLTYVVVLIRVRSV